MSTNKNFFNKVARFGLSVACVAMMGLFSCSEVDMPETPNLAKVSELAYTQDGRNVLLTWTLPQADNISGVQIIYNNTDVMELEGAVTEFLIKRPMTGVELTYTVKVMYADGTVSEGQTVRFTVAPVTMKIGLYVPETTAEAITDDDEIAAYEWFVANVENGEVITADQLDKVDPDVFSVIWINIDRVGIGAGWENLPAAVSSDEAITAFSGFLAEGGNLLLTKHATQLTVPFGRIPASFAPGLFGDGEGGDGTDIWTFNAQIGYSMSEVYDHRSHAIFEGLSTSDQYEWETFPLIGPGRREDHNCMWDINAYTLSDTPNKLVNFEQELNATVLGTWGHVVDYAVAGIVEFKATPDCPGRIIAIGLSAYEWNQNSGENPYQANIERLTDNCLNYLK